MAGSLSARCSGPARHEETILATAICRSTRSSPGRSPRWWGDPTKKDWGLASLEGGDVMPIGNRTVLIGMSEQ